MKNVNAKRFTARAMQKNKPHFRPLKGFINGLFSVQLSGTSALSGDFYVVAAWHPSSYIEAVKSAWHQWVFYGHSGK